MTLPPERITIKRRRDDEPVEALYIEQKRHCSSSTYWVRIRDGKPLDISATLSSQAHPDSVLNSNNHANPPGPKTQKSFSTQEATVKPPSPSVQIVKNAQGADQVEKVSIPPDQGKIIHAKKSSSSRPRVFHFSNKSKTLNAESMVSMHGVKKSRSGRRDLAVFEEKIKSARDLRDLTAGFRKGTNLSLRSIATLRGGEGIHANLKAQAVVSIGGDSSVTERLPEALDGDHTASKLRKVDEFTERPSRAGLHETQKERISDTRLQPQIKFQPKPATALHEEGWTSPTALEELPNAQDLECQDEYVYDTYLRTKLAMVDLQSDSPMDVDQINMLASGKVGILVIAEQDEEAWEAYGEEEESDKDWNSEEEDENAEDFYGNDYPEDEIDSDDEYGRDTYQYRNNNSDDEEFDRNWGDEEDEGSLYGRTRGGTKNDGFYD